jgi:hypothetical protein
MEVTADTMPRTMTMAISAYSNAVMPASSCRNRRISPCITEIPARRSRNLNRKSHLLGAQYTHYSSGTSTRLSLKIMGIFV